MRVIDIEERINAMVDPILFELGMELVDVIYMSENKRMVLKVFIDKPGGVSLDDCSRVSRELGARLDVEDVIRQSYVLEVSSPGIARPLKVEKDFKNAVGKKIRIKTKTPIEGRSNFKVVLMEFEDGRIKVRDSENRLWNIELSNIDKARCEIVLTKEGC